jgi:uncharacterized membrane protein
MNKRKTPVPARATRHHTGEHHPGSPPRDLVVGGLAVAGFAISLYLTITKLAGSTAAFCESGSGCDVVQASQWATFLGLPTASWGALLYAALAVLAFTGLVGTRWTVAFVLTCAAVAFSGYLTWISAFSIGAMCPWCLTVAAIGVASLIAVVLRPPAGARRRAMRPVRLTIIAVSTAVVTIVVAAGVFVMDPITGSAYAKELAQHLQATNGVMYGVFW